MRMLFLPLVLSAFCACSGSTASIPNSTSDGTLPTPAMPGATGSPTSSGGSSTPSSPTAAPTSTVPAQPTGPWPGSNLDILPFAAQKQASGAGWGVALTDLVTHLPASYGTQYDVPDDFPSWGRVVTVGIDNFLTNYQNVTGKTAGGFYLMKNRFTLVVEPPATKLASVATYVPVSLRGSRYQDSLVQPLTNWNDTPTYVFDDWVSYTNGSEVGVELVKNGSYNVQTDGVAANLELTVYSLALGLAVATLDAAYYASYTQFREFLAWSAERAMNLYRTGAVLPTFVSAASNAYYAAWRTSADAIPLRNYARRAFGGTYCTQVLGIGPNKE